MANTFQICQICFSVNVKMFTLTNTNLENLYKLLTQVYVDEEDGKPCTVCFICYARLSQCERLQRQAVKGIELWEQLISEGVLQDTANEILINKYRSQKLQVSPAYHIDLEPATCEDILLDDANDAAISLISEESDETFRLLLDFFEEAHSPNDFSPEVIISDIKKDDEPNAICSNESDGTKDIVHGEDHGKEQDKEKICKVQSEKELKDDPVPPNSTQIQQKDEGIEKITKINLKPKKNAFVTKKQKNQKAIKNCVDGRLDTTATKICNNSKRKLGNQIQQILSPKKSKFQIPVICKDTIKETNIVSETTLVNNHTEKICNIQSEKELKDDPVPPNSTQNQQKDEDVEKNTKIKLKPKKNAFVTKKQKNQKAIKNCVDGRSDSTATKKCNSYKRKLGKSKTDIVTKKSKFQIPVICKDTIKEANIGSETILSNTTTKEIKFNKYDEQFSPNEVLTDHDLNCTERTETLVNAQELTKKTLNSPLPDMYSCDICTFKTNKKRCIEPHLKMHTVSKVFSCHICEYRSARKSHLKRHIRIHTGEKPFNCNSCDYKCARKTNLKDHMRTHTGEKPFNCNICDYKCAQKNTLKNHMRTHTGEKPFICKICDYKCADKTNLKNHMRTHTGEKPFNCKICDYKCAHTTSLKKHMRTHTGEKPFNCNICDYKCAQKINLKTHIMTHTGDKPFSCDMCDYRCIQKSTLKSHLRTHK